MAEQFPEDPLSAKLRFDVHALDPPKIAVPPIAPFVSDHQLAGDCSLRFRDVINTFRWVGQERFHACFDAVGIQSQSLRFQGQAQIIFRDYWRVR